MLKTNDVEVDISDDKLFAWIHFPGLAYTDFGRTETLTQWALSRTFEATRYFGLVKGIIEFTSLVNRHTGYFVFGAQYTFEEELWRIPRTVNIPYKVSLEVQDMGNTSVTLFSRMVSKLDNKQLATASVKLVFVNRATRRSIPLPQWMHEKYDGAIKHRQKLSLPQSPPKISEMAFRFPATVTASDTDINRHTNQSSYLRYCCDAAQEAVRAGQLDTFRPDLARFPLQTMEVVYAGESAFGDSLCVFVWQKEDQPSRLQFVITREKENTAAPIFHASMVYGLKPVRVSRL